MKSKLPYFLLFILIGLGLSFTGCKEDNNTGLELSTQGINLLAFTNEDVVVTITSETAWDYTISEGGTWIVVKTSGDDKLLVNANANPGVAREAKIIVKNSSAQREITVKQAEADTDVLVFTAADIEYMGVSDNGYTAEVAVSLIKDNVSITYLAYDELFPVPSKYKIQTGEYSSDATHGKMTFLVPENLNLDYKIQSFIMVNGQKLAVLSGTLDIKEDEDIYTITSVIEAENPLDNTKYNYQVIYEGSVNYFSDYEPEYHDLYITPQEPEYHGDYYTNNGTARYTMNLEGDQDEDMCVYGVNILRLYSDVCEDSANAFLTPGVYTLSEGRELYTLLPGYLAEKVLNGAYMYYADPVNERLLDAMFAEHGRLLVEYDGNKYTITAHFAGRNIRNDEKIENMAFRFEGAITFRDVTRKLHIDYKINKIYTTGSGGSSSEYRRFGLELVSTRSENGDLGEIMFDVCTAPGATGLPAGTYYPSNDNSPFTYRPGYYSEENNIFAPSHLKCIDDPNIYSITRLVNINEGGLHVEQSGTDPVLYTITGDLFIGEDVYTGHIITFSVQAKDFEINFREF